jgi:hypothetical protein
MNEEPSLTPSWERLPQGPGPVFVDLGDGLGRLEVWSQSRWDVTDESERPARAEPFEGLGWVVAIPIRDLN